MAAEHVLLTCDDIEELAGAYALQALPGDELLAVEAHVASCQHPHNALRDLTETASFLSLACSPAAPPAGLERLILASATSELTRRRPTPIRELRPLVLTRLPQWFVLAAAATFAVISLGLGWWGVSQHEAFVRERAATARDGSMLAALAAGSVVIQTQAAGSLPPVVIVQPRDGSAAYLLVDWPRSEGRTIYQAWFISQGQKPVSAGVFNGASSGFQIVRLARAIQGAQAFAVTVEPPGGSDQPTSQPFLVSNLPS